MFTKNNCLQTNTLPFPVTRFREWKEVTNSISSVTLVSCINYRNVNYAINTNNLINNTDVMILMCVYPLCLSKKLKLPTLKYRRLRGDMIEVFTIIHGKYDKTCSLELALYQSVHATWTNSLKLTNSRCHYDLRKYFLAAELLIYGIVCHLKLLMHHHLIHLKTDSTDSGLTKTSYTTGMLN